MQLDRSNSPAVASEPPGGPDLAGVRKAPELVEIDAAEIRSALDRIVASPLFHQAEQPIRLLKFIVECSLSGGEAPKEYRLAVEALGRGPDFDPRNDTIVRVQVRKLRAKLAKYYETEGAAEAVVIDLPVGLYAAKFHRQSPRLEVAPSRPAVVELPRPRSHAPGFRAAVGLAAILGLAGLVLMWLLRPAPVRIEASQLTRLTWERKLYLDPALAADGKELVYAADAGQNNLQVWVQDTGGGEPVAVTSGAMNHQEPVISPDGKRVVFRSDGPNAGLWELTVGSSEAPKRFSKEGRQPRFSTDGSRLTFWVPALPNSADEPLSPLFFGPHSSVRALQHGLIFCTDPGTLRVRLLPLTLAAAGLPAWSPDGKYVVVYGAAEINPFRQEDADWWVAPTAVTVTPVKPVRTGIAAQLRRMGVEPVLSSSAWVGGQLYFSARSGETVDLWRAELSESTHQVRGSIRKVTLGNGTAIDPTAAASGKLAFLEASGEVNVWTLPVQANLGTVTGKLERITAGASPQFWPSVSADGRIVAFSSQRFGVMDLFVKDLPTGVERMLASGAEQPRISPDGTQVVFSRPENRTAAIYQVSVAGGNAVRKIADGGEISGWSGDGHSILFDRGSHLHGHRLYLSSNQDTEFSRHPVEDSFVQSMSPDQKFVALICQGKLYLAAVVAGVAAPDDQWIQITDGADRVDRARWSPDGNLLYFVSDRDGRRNIWAQHLEAASRKPQGPAFPVYRFDASGPSMDHLSPEVLSFDVAADRLVFTLGEFHSTVFLLSQ